MIKNKTILSEAIKLPHAGHDKSSDINDIHKRMQFLRSGLVVGILSECAFILLQDARVASTVSILVDLASILAFGLVYVCSFLNKHPKLLFNLTIAVVATTTILSFYDASATRAIFLAPLTALIAYLILSRTAGIIWTAIITVSILSTYFLDKFGVLQPRLERHLLLYGTITTIIISMLMYLYEGLNAYNEKVIAKRDKELVELNEKLEEQLLKNRTTAEELAVTLDATQRNNAALNDTKKAILNVLEDASELQTQLQSEKKDVEAKVLERTKELQHEKSRLTASINSIANGLLMTFEDDEQAISNPALQELLGLEEKGDGKIVHQLSYLNLVQDKLGKSFNLLKAIEKCQKIGQPFSADSIDYDKKTISISGAPIFLNGQQEVIGCVVVVDDITDSVMLERSKDEFISIASHELRTPLTAIRGNASMLVTMYGDQLPDGDIKGMVADIKDASVRLIGIVNQFLSTSRLEQKRTVYSMVPVEIGKTISACIRELDELVKEKGLTMTAKISDNLPMVLADDARTHEVVINIIGNAIKYTEKGTIHITAGVKGNFVEVDIQDTGIGIDPKNQSLLFHKFQQTTSDILTRDDSRSTGLGLYITKLLVEQMGGEIYLKESAIGKGSIFTFTLPIAETNV